MLAAGLAWPVSVAANGDQDPGGTEVIDPPAEPDSRPEGDWTSDPDVVVQDWDDGDVPFVNETPGANEPSQDQDSGGGTITSTSGEDDGNVLFDEGDDASASEITWAVDDADDDATSWFAGRD